MIRAVQAAPAEPIFDGSRLLALSGFLKKGSRAFETVVRGGSMGNALPDGSHIRVRFVSESEYVKGSVVAYVAQDRIIAHRVLRCVTSRGKRYLLTRGDSTALCDSPVPVEAAIGVVTHFETNEHWRPVPPLPSRPLGFRIRDAISFGMIAAVAKVSPHAARWIAQRLIALRAMRSRRKAAQVGA